MFRVKNCTVERYCWSWSRQRHTPRPLLATATWDGGDAAAWTSGQPDFRPGAKADMRGGVAHRRVRAGRPGERDNVEWRRGWPMAFCWVLGGLEAWSVEAGEAAHRRQRCARCARCGCGDPGDRPGHAGAGGRAYGRVWLLPCSARWLVSQRGRLNCTPWRWPARGGVPGLCASA